eukprot:TRINITY_DN2971_c0_g1_i1.p1 TRINITY_DN2971_c0_g1~~TRINITY_DN2971_c0_g1_i1.p1  ORF type:complete len:160 (+),score=47.23 TRINITY_DN2971_c0_g1_i1:363-842(+)
MEAAAAATKVEVVMAAGMMSGMMPLAMAGGGVHKSHVLECDEPNETIRLREGWDTWLLPNASGGRGAPRYIKLPSPGAAEMSTAADAGESPTAEAQPPTGEQAQLQVDGAAPSSTVASSSVTPTNSADTGKTATVGGAHSKSEAAPPKQQEGDAVTEGN